MRRVGCQHGPEREDWYRLLGVCGVLMKKRALKRRAKDRAILHRNGSVAMARGNRLKSMPLKPRSKKRAQLMREVRGPLVREILEERPLCERCVWIASWGQALTHELLLDQPTINRSPRSTRSSPGRGAGTSQTRKIA